MKRNNSKYWNDRTLKTREKLLDKTTAETEAELALQYTKTAKKLETKIQNLYQEVLDSTKDGTLLVSDLYKFNRYYVLLANINTELKRLNAKEVKLMNSKFEQMYKNNSKIVGKQLGIETRVDNDMVQRAINQAWCADGKVWSDRVWDNKTKLANKLESTLVDAVARGVSHDTLTKGIMKDFNQSFSNSQRLVRTELSHIYNESAKDRYIDAGITEIEWLTAPDCCDECQELDGVRFPVTSSQIPPAHPRCRCTIIPVINYN